MHSASGLQISCMAPLSEQRTVSKLILAINVILENKLHLLFNWRKQLLSLNGNLKIQIFFPDKRI